MVSPYFGVSGSQLLLNAPNTRNPFGTRFFPAASADAVRFGNEAEATEQIENRQPGKDYARLMTKQLQPAAFTVERDTFLGEITLPLPPSARRLTPDQTETQQTLAKNLLRTAAKLLTTALSTGDPVEEVQLELRGGQPTFIVFPNPVGVEAIRNGFKRNPINVTVEVGIQGTRLRDETSTNLGSLLTEDEKQQLDSAGSQSVGSWLKSHQTLVYQEPTTKIAKLVAQQPSWISAKLNSEKAAERARIQAEIDRIKAEEGYFVNVQGHLYRVIIKDTSTPGFDWNVLSQAPPLKPEKSVVTTPSADEASSETMSAAVESVNPTFETISAKVKEATTAQQTATQAIQGLFDRLSQLVGVEGEFKTAYGGKQNPSESYVAAKALLEQRLRDQQVAQERYTKKLTELNEMKEKVYADSSKFKVSNLEDTLKTYVDAAVGYQKALEDLIQQLQAIKAMMAVNTTTTEILVNPLAEVTTEVATRTIAKESQDLMAAQTAASQVNDWQQEWRALPADNRLPITEYIKCRRDYATNGEVNGRKIQDQYPTFEQYYDAVLASKTAHMVKEEPNPDTVSTPNSPQTAKTQPTAATNLAAEST